MLLLGALTNTNPVVDGFGVFNLSLANFVAVLANPNVHARAAQFADRLRRRHRAGRRDRARLLLDRRPHQHALQGLHRRGEHRCRCSCRRWSPPSPGRSSPPRSPGLLNTLLAVDRHRLALQRLFDVGDDRDLRRLLRALCLHVHGLGAAQHGPGAGRGRRDLRRNRALDAADGHVPADRAGDHFRHAALVHRHARHLRHSGGARHAGRHPGADDLHLQAHRLVAAALFDRGRGRHHPDGGDGLPRVAAAPRASARAATSPSPARRFARR